jgi:DEAD/DEAH box helicase domain-containing protein
MPMDASTFLTRLPHHRWVRDQIVCARALPARPAAFADVPGGLAPAVQDALALQGIECLYAHQAEAITRLRAGESVVIITGTASGKTLCFNIPVAERLLQDPMATALYLYPTKALTQDQLRGVGRFHLPEQGLNFLAGAYDGDTPTTLRRRLRDTGNIILTNPDMLHQGILPQHARWHRFFSHLQFVVLDEVHAYRGVFGSHLANVMRRLRRICAHYGSHPQFICSSATIANPQAHAAAITGTPMSLISEDGSPRGPRQFVLWNPPLLEGAARGDDRSHSGGDRKGPLGEAIHLMSALVEEGVQTIAFVRTRLAAELLTKGCRERLGHVSRKLAEGVQAYRGGYLPEERREIERRLVNREILGVASTNALELGIDIGSLDACLLVGYPGTIASLWQQAGRAGRGQDEALVVLIGQNSPIDQYLMTHSDYLFAQSPETAVVDPDNPHITIGHVKCAAHELPLRADELESFGPYTDVLLELSEEERVVKRVENRWYWASTAYPATEVNLRNIAGPVFTIQDETAGVRVIGTIDEQSAMMQLHNHAVYLHNAETYFVTALDLEQKIVRVERRDLDYYTQSIQVAQIKIDSVEEEQTWQEGPVGYGDVTVTTSIPMFKKIRFGSRDSLGFEALELPPQSLETVACWLSPPAPIRDLLMKEGKLVGEALIGVANVLVEVASLYIMSEAQDLGAVVDASCLGRDALFIFDRYPGGMGYARRCLENLDKLLTTARDVIRSCGCPDGCPSCVGAASPAFALNDLDSAVRDRIPDKAAALLVLESWL